jgi:CheY-like chemotaxis protein
MSAQKRNSAGTEQRQPRKVVVLVEDEPGLRSAWLELLSEVGYKVHQAENGRIGLELVRDVQPDIVITDLVMPIEDGRTLANAMRSDRQLRAIPIIAATGDSPQPSDGELFDVVLRKPFNSTALLRALTELLVPLTGGWRPLRSRDLPMGPLRARRN